jgi:hypothetical protein
MLTITLEQFDVFAQRSQSQFVETLTDTVASAYPEIAWQHGWAEGPDRLRLLVQKFIGEGYAWGLTIEYTLARYTYYRLDFGEELLTDTEWEWLRDILSYETVPEEEKIRQIDCILYGGPIYPETWDYE